MSKAHKHRCNPIGGRTAQFHTWGWSIEKMGMMCEKCGEVMDWQDEVRRMNAYERILNAKPAPKFRCIGSFKNGRWGNSIDDETPLYVKRIPAKGKP
jgi:hypothetical protein